MAAATSISTVPRIDEMLTAAVWLPHGELNRWVRNPRKNAVAVPKVEKSIRRFGFIAPIVVWTSANRMVAGDTRVLAMRAIMAAEPMFQAKGAPGPGLVRVVFHEFENEREADLYALADNKLGEIAEWDDAAVTEILAKYDVQDRVNIGFEEAVVIEPPEPPKGTHAETRKLGSWAILQGDAQEEMAKLEANSFDAVMCDSPYGLSFMGKKWDYDVPAAALWVKAFDALKPGAPLVNFSATRTYHRMAVQVEDAGFEIRDMFSWLYGEGFPKSTNVSKELDHAAGATRRVVGRQKLTGTAQIVGGAARTVTATGDDAQKRRRTHVDITAPSTQLAKDWDGYGTALKPACEPAVLARKPLEGTIAANVAKWGTGALWIDGARVGTDTMDVTASNGTDTMDVTASNGTYSDSQTFAMGRMTNTDVVAKKTGRWPANVIMDEAAGAALDEQSGNRPSTLAGRADPTIAHDNRSDVVEPGMFGVSGGGQVYADDGGASRFFYCAKVSRREREEGTVGLPKKKPAERTGRSDDEAPGTKRGRSGGGSAEGAANFHPTVKPVSLARHIATLLLPPPRADGKPRRILVPFSGSGSEMIGALLAGWDEVVGIEREADYITIARARISHAVANPRAWEPEVDTTEEVSVPA